MEQNRNPRNKPTRVCIEKMQKQFNQQRLVFSLKGNGTIKYAYSKTMQVKLDPHLTLYTKVTTNIDPSYKTCWKKKNTQAKTFEALN